MKTQSYLLPFLTVSSVLVEGFQVLPSSSSFRRIRPNTFLEGGQADESNRPSNEFSRTVPPDKVLKLHGKHQRSQGSNRMPERQYSVEIDASPEECKALASRFELPAIESLEASLSLSPEGNSAVESARGIVVQGTVRATVTRTCVRTNENFQVDMEFPVYSLVRPVQSSGPTPTLDLGKSVSFVELNRDNSSSKKKKDQSAYDEDAIDPMELLKIQSMLEGLEQNGEDVDDILMEDEFIYATTGALDVGELVSQLFWLELDPYPRKPGSEFLQFSISG